VKGWLLGVSLRLQNWFSADWWVGVWVVWWCICLHGGSASFVLVIMSLWFPSVLVSVYVLDVCMEGKYAVCMVYVKDYVCLHFNHHAGAVEGCSSHPCSTILGVMLRRSRW
jgi:hypothetical protein